MKDVEDRADQGQGGNGEDSRASQYAAGHAKRAGGDQHRPGAARDDEQDRSAGGEAAESGAGILLRVGPRAFSFSVVFGSGVDADTGRQRRGVVRRQSAGHADQLHHPGVGDLVAGVPAVAAGGDEAAVGQAGQVR